jgi:hypothetical protein
VPAEQRVGRHDWIQFEETAPSDRHCSPCQLPTLRVGEYQSAASQSATEHPVLGLQIVDGFSLLALYPTGAAGDQIAQERGSPSHRSIFAGRSIGVNRYILARLSFRTVRQPPTYRDHRRPTPQSAGAELTRYRWQSHCRGLFQLPIAA